MAPLDDKRTVLEGGDETAPGEADRVEERTVVENGTEAAPDEILRSGRARTYLELIHRLIDAEAEVREESRDVFQTALTYLLFFCQDDTDIWQAWRRFDHTLWADARKPQARLRALQLAYRAVLAQEAARAAEKPAKVPESGALEDEPVATPPRDELRELLTTEERTILVLRFTEGLPWTEIAAVLSFAGAPVEPATVSAAFDRVWERLKDVAHGFPEPLSDSGVPLNCGAFVAGIEEVAFRGDFPEGALRAHLGSCRRCAAIWAREQILYAKPGLLRARVNALARLVAQTTDDGPERT